MSDKSGKKIVIVRKKKVVAGGHHGGSWKVAYADFVTAMMAFFMVMWILGMDDKVKQAIEGYFANPVGYRKGAGAGTSPISSGSSPTKIQSTQLKLVIRAAESKRFGEISQQIKQLVAKNGQLKRLGAKVDVIVTKDGLRIELIESGSGDVFFPLGSSQMKPAAAIALNLIAPELKALSNPIILEGHTDAAAFGASGSYGNWELSTERANAARRVLEASGLAPRRVREVRGLADTQLRDPAKPLDPSNRRISIFLPYSDVPDVDEAVRATDAPPPAADAPKTAARPAKPTAPAHHPAPRVTTGAAPSAPVATVTTGADAR